MIDENLPVFYFQKIKEKGVFDTPILLSEQGTAAGPAYTLRRLDPAAPQSQNRYAVALYDAWVPDLLYGEVLLEPNWTQPTLSADAIRANGGVAPPPQPLMPDEFTIQLYNPDQQIKVRHAAAGFTTAASWEFAMPQETFKRPSNSTLDRAESNPTALASTPMINMRWKRTGKFSKDLMCYLTGKSQNPDGSKKKQKEPDIPLSFFHQFSELTIYEPNVMRLDMEDLKGFEVAIILCAATIRDVFFNTLREAFHVTEIDLRSGANGMPRRSSGPAGATNLTPGTTQRQNRPEPQVPNGFLNSGRPALDPRKQWEIDTETARLKQQVQEEEQRRKRQEAADAEHARRIMENEQREERERQARRLRNEEKETQRLRQEWEAERAKLRGEGFKPGLPPRAQDKGKKKESGHHHHHHGNHGQQRTQSPYLNVGPDISDPTEALGPEVKRPKSSLGGGLNIFGRSEDKDKKVLKKKSSIW